MTAVHREVPVLAARLSGRLPYLQLRWLAEAALGGSIGLARARRQASSAVMRAAVDEVVALLVDGAGAHVVGGALLGACEAVRLAQDRQRLDVVWTGPTSRVRTSRLTEAVVAELIREAEHDVLLVSYATRPDREISVALAFAVDKGVEITSLLERAVDNPGYRGASDPFPGLVHRQLAWPAASRSAGASMHAKVLVVDGSVALVGSANLTGSAMTQNLECGVLIRGGPEPEAIRTHVLDLWERQVLVRV